MHPVLLRKRNRAPEGQFVFLLVVSHPFLQIVWSLMKAVQFVFINLPSSARPPAFPSHAVNLNLRKLLVQLGLVKIVTN